MPNPSYSGKFTDKLPLHPDNCLGGSATSHPTSLEAQAEKSEESLHALLDLHGVPRHSNDPHIGDVIFSVYGRIEQMASLHKLMMIQSEKQNEALKAEVERLKDKRFWADQFGEGREKQLFEMEKKYSEEIKESAALRKQIEQLTAELERANKMLSFIRDTQCTIHPFSSRACEFGTKGCNVCHVPITNNPIDKQDV